MKSRRFRPRHEFRARHVFHARHRRPVELPALPVRPAGVSAAVLSVTLLTGGSSLAQQPVVAAPVIAVAPPVAPPVAPAFAPVLERVAPVAPVAPAAPERPRTAKVAPVTGLTKEQAANAAVIVKQGRALGLPDRALVVAVATAMQESNLYNVASGVVPESLTLPHEGVGADHDSVGLFQQRPSQGWGTVPELMDPATSARKFYAALRRVPGWELMSVTQAAQSVQRSAFPDAYERHTTRAEAVVAALT